jgi:hypothetical protein
MLTRTRLVVSHEPDPLAAVKFRTASWLLPQVELVLDRIVDVLEANDAQRSVDILAHARQRRTRIQYEPDPLEIPAGRPSHPPRAPELPGAAAHLDRCLEELQQWLGTGLAEICEAAGFNRTTVYAWRRRGSNPRPGTVSSVLRLHGLVASAVAVAGEARAKEWFHAGSPSPLARLSSAAGDPATLTAVGRDLRRALTGPPLPPPNPLLGVTLDDSPARALA